MFKKRAKSAPMTYSTRSGAGHGLVTEWPSRAKDDAARHAAAYNEQKPRLEAQVAKLGKTSEEMFIPAVFAMERPEGGAYTWTSWTQGIPAMLPPSDVIFMVEQPATADGPFLTMRVRWDVVADLCADTCWKAQPEFTPPRVLIVGWPTPAEIEALKGKALEVQVRTAKG
jgi:hypothetical protein